MLGRVTVREMLYCLCDEISAEGLLDQVLQQSSNVHSLEVLVKRRKETLVNQITRHRTVTHAAMT